MNPVLAKTKNSPLKILAKIPARSFIFTESNHDPMGKFISLLFGGINIKGFWPNLLLLLTRIYAGFTIMSAGLDKLPLTDWMTEQVQSMGFPFPTFFAWVASWSEFAFGLLLCLGLLTRLSGLMLAITMGVASFGFQKVLPLVDMHIAQGYFWMFALFMVIGAGQYSVDHWLNRRAETAGNKAYGIGIAALVITLGIGLFLEFSGGQEVSEATDEEPEMTINVPGNFNGWDPTANIMEKLDANNYRLHMEIDRPQVLEFKFTANQSWDMNLGETDQESKGFPISGTAELDDGNNTQNIVGYIPAPGEYQILLNLKTYQYSVDTIER